MLQGIAHAHNTHSFDGRLGLKELQSLLTDAKIDFCLMSVCGRVLTMIRRRFDKLCRFLSENSARFQTCVFQGHKPSDVLTEQPACALRGRIDRTLFRYVEQALGRIG